MIESVKKCLRHIHRGADVSKTLFWYRKVKCLKNIVKLCKDKNIKLFFIVSPLYNAANSSDYDFGRTFAQENGIPFIDHLNDTTISKNISYFYDPLHMNIDGANTYTKKIIPEPRAILT